MQTITRQIAEELNVRPAQVIAAVGLLDNGATVPFIARYRKEVTGTLDDTQLRRLEERLRYLRELEERREAILKSIDEQGRLSDGLRNHILAADTKNRLEDLYLPYKPKRRTKGQIAIEAGLEPLADALYTDPSLDPETSAADYVAVERGVADTKVALDGAKYILMERFAEDADLVGRLRDFLVTEAVITAAVIGGKENDGAKFRDYFEHTEPLCKVPSHRALAMFRGRNEGFLTLAIKLADEPVAPAPHPCQGMVARHVGIAGQGHPADAWLAEVVRWTWRVKLLPHLETDLLGQLRERAETGAIEVFAANLRDLLLAAPAGARATIGLDPGLRTGVKVAVIDATGKVVDHGAIYPTPPQNRTAEAAKTLVALAKKYAIELIAIGNGTAGRETDHFVGELIAANSELTLTRVMVNEAGASVYSASEFAARELPDLDVTIRGAVSIGRRLQDPLAELVKIDPKSIGVGQYQHDVSQAALARQLDASVEDCVNAVGVDLNTASAALLTRVSGLSRNIAENIVTYRDHHGVFTSRKALKSVPRLGDKTFELAAGFLRIAGAENPLDASAVHPESYPIVDRIARDNGRKIKGLIGDSAFLKGLNPNDYVDDKAGLPTVIDIIAELDKPGRDPRPEFRTAQFAAGIEKPADLKPGMRLEGTVTNVTNFGAFVDVGVHQDGLVHVSQIADRFVKDPRDVVKAGDIVRVRVIDVDLERNRISLTIRSSGGSNEVKQHSSRPAPKAGDQKGKRNEPKQGTLGDLLREAQRKK